MYLAKPWRLLLAGLALLILSGCAVAPPQRQDNLCEIFRQQPGWYEDALYMTDRYGVPIHVAMSFIKQESAFVQDARPPRRYVLGFIPWGRVSSAYGYAQALDGVWQEYQQEDGSWWSDRDEFDDAILFVGWYISNTNRRLKISKWDAYNQYLAYHEGTGGYKRRSYTRKPWLMKVARKVDTTAKNYAWQLKKCRQELENNRSWFF